MAQKLNEALLRLELEVVGADAIKKAADAVGAYGERTKALQPARVETIIGAVDTATPVLQKAATSHIEYARLVQQSAAVIQTALKQTLTQEKQYAEALRNLGVPGRLVSGGMREIRPQVREAVRASIGLLPEDMEAIGLSGRLYRQAAMASKALNFADLESQRKANLGTRTVVQLAPVVLGPDITENASYRLLKRAAGRETIGPGDVQKALAELAPLMAQQQLLDIYRAALRLTAAQALGRSAPTQLERRRLFEENPEPTHLLTRPFFFEQQRQGFKQLAKVEPELAGRLQATIPLGVLEQPRNPDLERMALLIASRQQLVAPGLGLQSERRSPLEVAQALRIRSFGPTEAEAPRRKIPKTRDLEIRDTEGEVVGIREGKYLPFVPGPTTLFRPKTRDVKEITAGPMQKPRLLLPPTAIETTVREVGPITPGQQALISEAEATVSQSRSIVPDETIYERFQRIGYQKGLQKIQERIAKQKAKYGVPIPSTVEFPEEYLTEKLAKEEKETGGKASKKPTRPRRRRFFGSNIDELGTVSTSIFDLGEDPSRQGFLRGPKIKPSPDIPLAQQAQNLLEEYKKSTIFPKTFSKLLDVTPETGETLIKSLQAQGILGQPAGPGLAGALPIIKSQSVVQAIPAPEPIKVIPPPPIQVPIVPPKPTQVSVEPPEPIRTKVLQPESVKIPIVPPQPIQIPITPLESVKVPIELPKPIQVPVIPPEPIRVFSPEKGDRFTVTEGEHQGKEGVVEATYRLRGGREMNNVRLNDNTLLRLPSSSLQVAGAPLDAEINLARVQEQEAQVRRTSTRAAQKLAAAQEAAATSTSKPQVPITQQAVGLLEQYNKPTIFPKTFSRLLEGAGLTVEPDAQKQLIKTLQKQGILGQPKGTGLAGALPILARVKEPEVVTPVPKIPVQAKVSEPATPVIPVAPIIPPPPAYVRTGRPRDVSPEPGTQFVGQPSVYPRTPGTGPIVYGPGPEPTPKPTLKIEIPKFGGRGSISKQAIDLLEGYEKPTIFPSVFSKALNIEPSVGQTLIKSLQDQGYLGQAAGPGLASALPIIGAQTRRTQQAKLEIEEIKLTEATAEEAQTRRAAANAVRKLAGAQAAAAGGGGGGRRGGSGGGGPEGPDEEEPGKGKRKGPPPAASPFSRFAGRFTGLSYYLGAAAVLYPILGALSQADQSAKELQTTVQRIQGIYGSHTLSEQLEIKAAIITAAQKYGENLTEVANAAERFSQAQESIKNIGADLQTAAAGSRAFGTNMQQIAEFMIGIQEATGGKTTGQQGANLVAAFSRQGVVSPLSLMTAMQQLTPITSEQFAAPSGAISDPALIGSILQTVSQRSGLSGTSVANAMRYMFARFGRTETAGVIEELSGVNLGTLASGGQELKPLAEILRDLAAAYEQLLATGQSAKATQLLTYLFGPRQIGPGAIFLKEMVKILDDAMRALRDTGALAERAGQQLSTLETAQKKLHNSLTELWGTSLLPIRTGLDNFINQIVEMANAFARAGDEAIKFYKLTPEEQHAKFRAAAAEGHPLGPPVSEAQERSARYIRDLKDLDLGEGSPKPKIPFKGLGGFEEFAPRILVGPGSNKPEPEREGKGVGLTPSAPIYERPPLRNVFAEIMLKGQVSLEAQLQRAQAATISQQTQTSLQLNRMLRQAQGKSTINLELQGIEAGRTEQRAVNLTTYQEQLKLYSADFARVNKEITDIQRNVKLDVVQKRTAIRPLEEERLSLAARTALLIQQYSQEAQILDIKTEQAKQNAIQLDQMRQQVDKLKELSNIGRIAQDFVTQGLQGVAQALGGGGSGRGGKAVGALAGAAATSLGAIMSQGLDLFGPQGAFPGVGKTLYNKLGRPSEADITAQAKQLAPALQANFPGMSLVDATQRVKDALTKKLNKQQALTAIGEVGGSLLGSAIGGNAQGAQVGATLGAAAGNLIVPGIGGLIGGGIGGIIGGFVGGHPKPRPEIGDLKIIADNSGEQVRLLENTNKLLETNFVSFNVPTGFRLPSYQPGFFGGIAASRGASGNVVNSAIHVNVNIGGTNVAADKLGSTIAQAISDRLELESRSSGAYFPRTLYG